LVEALRQGSDPAVPNVIAFLGVPGQNPEYYVKIAQEIGIENETPEEGGMVKRILTPESGGREIRRALDIFFQTRHRVI
jgi:hypothetical protein